MKKKVVFLFGAGAEDGLELPQGGDFASKLLFHSKDDAMSAAIKKYYKKCLSDPDLENSHWYSNYHVTRGYKTATLLKKSIQKSLLNEDRRLGSQFEFDSLINKKIEEYESEESKKKFIVTYPSYMHLLDRNFHTIMEPRVYGSNNFWKVINLYTRAYLVMTTSILKIKEPTEKDCLDILNDPKQTLENINQETLAMKEKNGDSYYKLLAEWKGKIESQIITTNYTPYAKEISEVDEIDIAYVHGKIGWFECPFDLQVYDYYDTNEMDKTKNKLVFPYLFIQSGIKPIIEYKQLNEYSKMKQFLDNNNTLIVIGYGLNIDDNHINSILHHFLNQEENTMYYLDFNGKCGVDHLLYKLRLSKNAKVNLKIIPTHKKNCYQELEKLLDELYQETLEKALNK